MTLPVEVLQRRPGADRYDVAVVGAGVGGLVCASILARNGMRVVLVDRAKRPGGGVQTIAHQGFAIDLAPHLWEAAGLREALAAAGVRELALAEVSLRDAVRVAVVAGAAVRDEPRPLPVPGAVPSPSMLDAVRALYGVPPRVFAALGGLYDELARASAEQMEDWHEAPLADWLAERGVEPVVAAAVRRSTVLLGAADPDAVSVAALATRSRWLAGEARAPWIAPADNPIAGGRGIVQALVDAFVEAGGDLRLGTRAVALDVERGRVRALGVQREEQPFLDEIVADRVVLVLPPRVLSELLPGATWSQIAALPAAAAPRRSALAIAFGFREPPAPRHGDESAHVVILVPPVAAAGSSGAGVAASAPPPGVPAAPVVLSWPTAWAPRIAPPGQALLVAHTSVPDAHAGDLGEIARATLLVRTAVVELYAEAREAIAWERHWLRRDAWAEPFALPSLPLVAPGCENVLLAGSRVAAPALQATGATAAALSGRAAAERILAPAMRAAIS